MISTLYFNVLYRCLYSTCYKEKAMGESMRTIKPIYFTNCPKCAGKMGSIGSIVTLVGFSSQEGHSHDDNCERREYVCSSCGHKILISKRRKCYATGCDWKGKETCFCHKGKKVDEWPKPYNKALHLTGNSTSK